MISRLAHQSKPANRPAIASASTSQRSQQRQRTGGAVADTLVTRRVVQKPDDGSLKQRAWVCLCFQAQAVVTDRCNSVWMCGNMRSQLVESKADRLLARDRNPLRCQAMTVAGLTMTSAERQPDQRRDNQTKKMRSSARIRRRCLRFDLWRTRS